MGRTERALVGAQGTRGAVRDSNCGGLKNDQNDLAPGLRYKTSKPTVVSCSFVAFEDSTQLRGKLDLQPAFLTLQASNTTYSFNLLVPL
jgi:hypothetical protein